LVREIWNSSFFKLRFSHFHRSSPDHLKLNPALSLAVHVQAYTHVRLLGSRYVCWVITPATRQFHPRRHWFLATVMFFQLREVGFQKLYSALIALFAPAEYLIEKPTSAAYR
jgi:hypothetical protein